MIKLIATDMDGTLLDHRGYLPEGFVEILNRLRSKKIKLVIASGRPYYTLQSNFGPMSGYLSYICENGALVIDNNEVIHKSIIDNNLVKEIIKIADSIIETAVVLCSPTCAYIEEVDDDIMDEVKKYYTCLKVVDDLNEVNDEIIKITLCNLDNSKETLDTIFQPQFGEKLSVVGSGQYWIDMTNTGVNKGIALKKLMETDNITSEETMALGDYYNDVEMLKQADYSFVMENAPEDMKQHAKYIAASNKEHGVLRAIVEYAL